MADHVTRKGPIGQQPNTTDDATAKAPADTGDRELSDADLDKVSGGMAADPPPPRPRPISRAQ